MTANRLAGVRRVFARYGAPGMRSNLIYLSLMGTGAAISLFRGFAVAAILTAPDFGLYALLVAVAVFLSPVGGAGKIEETRKRFPRMGVDGHGVEIVRQSDDLTWLVGKRIAVGGVVLAPFALLWSQGEAALVLPCALIVFGNGWCTILASALRSGKSLVGMGTATATRALVTLGVVIMAGHFFGLSGAMWGEAASSILGGFIMRVLLARQEWPLGKAEVDVQRFDRKVSWNGLRIFFGYIAVAMPIYLGRSFVGLNFSPMQLGAYSFLMLIVNAVVTGLGITDQIFGPHFIRTQREGTPFRDHVRGMLQIVGILAAVIIIALILLFLLFSHGPLRFFVTKYQLSTAFYPPIILYSSIQMTTTLDWFLLAHDRERQLLRSSAVFLASFALICAWTYLRGATLLEFLWLQTLAKALHFLIEMRLATRPPAPAGPILAA